MKLKIYQSLLLAGIVSASAFGQTVDKTKIPTQLEAVYGLLQNDGDNAYFLFTEKVKLRATNMSIDCDKLEIFAKRDADEQGSIGNFNSIKEIIATGNVKIVQVERTALCDKAIVKPQQQLIELTGSPATIEEAGGVVSSPSFIMNKADGEIVMGGNSTQKFTFTGPALDDLGFKPKDPVPTGSADLEAPEAETTEEPAEEPAPDVAEPTSESSAPVKE